ncbi:BrnT family toxin [Bifidobacterium sp. ESL0728]|uniref:BrnT family toxin n=1 Tax=Bifidobacterium sp. ESL0728 TaxID=2983220 RepID=UPI0023F6FE86|nr:BrnT family toxin [Bifidobacterium sp. ESL0728]WEV59766.1 BrnT family toxin [Bifidobacterium sp. ESL0728]
MEFEFDPNKSASNLKKHGIDFDEAQRLWYGPTFTFDTKPGNDESRQLVLGIINEKHWTAITTNRNGKTRIISVRRSRDYEEETYDKLIQNH